MHIIQNIPHWMAYGGLQEMMDAFVYMLQAQ